MIGERESSNDVPHGVIPQTVVTISEACIRAARHSHYLISEEWIQGTLPIFGYFHAHYLFSASIIMIISSLLPIGSASDRGHFETAIEILRSMSEHGNLSATEFYWNLQLVKQCLPNESRQAQEHSVGDQSNSNTITQSRGVPPLFEGTGTDSSPVGLPSTMTGFSFSTVPTVAGLTAEMALSEPTMQDFLAQSNLAEMLINDPDSLSTIAPSSLWTT